MAIASFFCGAIAVFSVYLAMILFVFSSVFYTFLILYYFTLRFKYTEYTLSSYVMFINKGVFFKKYTSLFKDNIQFVEVIQSPLQKKFNLCTVIFYLAGKKCSVAQINYLDGQFIKNAIGCDELEQ